MGEEIKYHAWTSFSDGAPAYASDKPGCDGRKKSSATPNSCWGYGTKKNALELSEYECRQFVKFQNSVGRNGSFSPI